MANPFIDRNALTPRLAEEVAGAYKYNVERGFVPSATLTQEVNVTGLDNEIKAAIAEAAANPRFSFDGLGQIKNPETKRIFETSFATSERIFERIDLTVPTPEQLSDDGIDLGALGAIYEQMVLDDLEPAIVLSPNLGLLRWKLLYMDLVNDKVVNADRRLSGDGLAVYTEVAAWWDELALPSMGVPVVHAINDELGEQGLVGWTLRLIPSTQEPTHLNVPQSHNNAEHPTVGEYLSLQAARIQNLQTPIDSSGTNTWLKGSFNSDGISWRSPVVYLASQQVMIGYIYTDQIYEPLGTRLPVWK